MLQPNQNSRFDQVKRDLLSRPKRWLVTGAAGFIGSHLVEHLLGLGQTVVGLDDLSSGFRRNLDMIVGKKTIDEKKFHFIEGSIQDAKICQIATEGVDYILHHAAYASVPGSIEDPLHCLDVNVLGFTQLVLAAKQAKVSRFVFASSSAVHGEPESPGSLKSTYALSKKMNELSAAVFKDNYGIDCIGLRYFNVFGQRQNPNGEYAAVISKWMSSIQKGDPIFINGDGNTTRDFCHVDNVVQANILAATTTDSRAIGSTFDIGNGQSTTLNDLYRLIESLLEKELPKPQYRPFRKGDIRNSVADITQAKAVLGYEPFIFLEEGLRLSMDWYKGSDHAV